MPARSVIGNRFTSSTRYNGGMKTRRQFRRWLAWPLILALLGMTSSSGAAWQCPDGHLCPPDCMMAAHTVESAVAQPPPPECSRCAEAEKVVRSGAEMGCTSPVCVLRISPKPAATSVSKVFVTIDSATVLPMSVVVVESPESTSPSIALITQPPRSGGTPPHAPRAPPTFL